MRKSRVVFAFVASTLFACAEPDVEQSRLDESVSTGPVHGVPGFYFYPPIGATTAYPGVFDPTLYPVVEIDRIDPVTSTTLAVIETLSRLDGVGDERLRLVRVKQMYFSRWHTGDHHLDPDATYRIRVLVKGRELGAVDLDVVRTRKELKQVDTTRYVGVLDGSVLPIKFRIEDGLPPPPPGDPDADGLTDDQDDCPTVANPDQLDTDDNGIGDVCECLDVTCGTAGPCFAPGVCDPANGECVDTQLVDGTACYDGDQHTGPDVCDAGLCVGPARDPATLILIDVTVHEWTVVGELVTGTTRAVDIDGQRARVELASGPPGLYFTGDDRFEWMPRQPGTFDVVLTADNGVGSGTRTVRIVVSDVVAAASRVVSAARGGVVEVTDPASELFGTKLQIPPHALAANTRIKIARMTTPPPALATGDVAFELLPSGLEFSIPVTLTMPNASADARHEISILAQAGDTFDADQPLWIPVGSEDTAGGVTAQLTHFCSFKRNLLDLLGLPQVFETAHFKVEYRLGTPICTAEEIAAGAFPCSAVPGTNISTGSDPEVPDYVEDVAAALERSYGVFEARGFAVLPESEGKMTATLVDGLPYEGLTSCFAPSSILINARLLDDDIMRATVGHELFHLMQCRAGGGRRYSLLSNEKEARWIDEGTAEMMGLEVFPGASNMDDPEMLYRTPIEALDGGVDNPQEQYRSFAVFEYLLQHLGLDIPFALYNKANPGVLGNEFRLARDAKEWFYRKADGIGPPDRTWQDFAVSYQFTDDPDWIRDADKWLITSPPGPPAFRVPLTNAPSGAETSAARLALKDQPRQTTVAPMAPGMVTTFVVDLRTVCPAPIGSACAGNASLPDPSSMELVIHANIDVSVIGRVYVVDPLVNYNFPDPVVQPVRDAGEGQFPGDLTPTLPELRIPLDELRSGQYVAVSFWDNRSPLYSMGAFTQSAAVDVFFAPSLAPPCAPVLAGRTLSWAIKDGALWQWGGAVAGTEIPRRVPGFESGILCIDEGDGGVQILHDNGVLELLGGVDPAIPAGIIDTDVKTMSANAYVKTDGSLHVFGARFHPKLQVWGNTEETYGNPRCPFESWNAAPTTVVWPPENVGLANVVRIAGNPTHNLLALTRDGSVFWYGIRGLQNGGGSDRYLSGDAQGDGTIAEWGGSQPDDYNADSNYVPLPVSLAGKARWVAVENQAIVDGATGARELWGWSGSAPTCELAEVAEFCHEGSRADVCPSGLYISESGWLNYLPWCTWASFPGYPPGEHECFTIPGHTGPPYCSDTPFVCQEPQRCAATWARPGYPTPILAQNPLLTAPWRVFQFHALMKNGSIMSYGNRFYDNGAYVDWARGDGPAVHDSCEPTPVTVPQVGPRDTHVQWVAYSRRLDRRINGETFLLYGGGDALYEQPADRALFWSFDGTTTHIYGTGKNVNRTLAVQSSGGDVNFVFEIVLEQ